MTSPRFISSEEAAKRCDVTNGTIHRWCKNGRFRYEQRGIDKKFYINAVDVRKHMADKPGEKYITPEETSVILGNNISTCLHMCARKRLDSVKWNNKWYVLKSSAEGMRDAGYDPEVNRKRAGGRATKKLHEVKAATSAKYEVIPSWAHIATMLMINRIRDRHGLEPLPA